MIHDEEQEVDALLEAAREVLDANNELGDNAPMMDGVAKRDLLRNEFVIGNY